MFLLIDALFLIDCFFVPIAGSDLFHEDAADPVEHINQLTEEINKQDILNLITIENLRKHVIGVHSCEVVTGKAKISIAVHGLDVFELLPNLRVVRETRFRFTTRLFMSLAGKLPTLLTTALVCDHREKSKSAMYVFSRNTCNFPRPPYQLISLAYTSTTRTRLRRLLPLRGPLVCGEVDLHCAEQRLRHLLVHAALHAEARAEHHLVEAREHRLQRALGQAGELVHVDVELHVVRTPARDSEQAVWCAQVRLDTKSIQ
jgi:hypothetical protein